MTRTPLFRPNFRIIVLRDGWWRFLDALCFHRLGWVCDKADERFWRNKADGMAD